MVVGFTTAYARKFIVYELFLFHYRWGTSLHKWDHCINILIFLFYIIIFSLKLTLSISWHFLRASPHLPILWYAAALSIWNHIHCISFRLSTADTPSWKTKVVRTLSMVYNNTETYLFWLVWLFIVFNDTCNNISFISWRSVLLVEETGEHHWHVVSYWQTLSHNVVWSTPSHEWGSNSQLLWW